MSLHIGTSGWTYDDWKGVFYPENVKGTDRLEYYAGKFDTVEVNTTFYRLPGQAMIDSWNRRLPESFHLVVPRAELKEWADRLQPHLAGRTLYAFFNNDYDAHAPRNAQTLRELLQGNEP